MNAILTYHNDVVLSTPTATATAPQPQPQLHNHSHSSTITATAPQSQNKLNKVAAVHTLAAQPAEARVVGHLKTYITLQQIIYTIINNGIHLHQGKMNIACQHYTINRLPNIRLTRSLKIELSAINSCIQKPPAGGISPTRSTAE